MPTLSSSLVKHQVASVEDVSDALARQAQYGGDLITNLLELANVSEASLTQAIAEAHGLEAAPIGELPAAPESVRRLVPGDLAARFGFYPLSEVDGVLTVAVSEPLPAEVESDMTFSLGTAVTQRAALLVRVRQAIARDYGTALDRRTERILARLAGQPDPSPSLAPPALAAPAPAPSPAPAVVEPEIEPAKAPTTPVSAVPAAAPAEEPAPASPPKAAKPIARGPALASLARREARSAQRSRRRGPYTAAMAEKDLLEAETRDDVLCAFFDFAAQYFEYSALFAVHGDLAEGRDAHGPGASRTKLLSIGVPLDLPSNLSSARLAPAHLLVRLGSDGLDGALAKDLERKPGKLILLLPVRVGSRAVLILYGDHGDADVQLDAVGDVMSLVPLVSAAIERLILQRKRQGSKSAALPFVPPVRRRSILPSPEERAQALASALESERRKSSRPPPSAGTGTRKPAELPSSPPQVAKPEPSLTPAPVAARPEPPPKAPSEPALPAESKPPSARPRVRPAVPSLSSPPKDEGEAPASIAEAISRSQPVQPKPSKPPFFAPEVGTKPGVGASRRVSEPTPTPAPKATPAFKVTPVPTATPAPRPAWTPTPAPVASSSTPSPSPSQRLQLVPEPAEEPHVSVQTELTDDDVSPQIELTDDDVSPNTHLTDADIDEAWDHGLEDVPSSRVEMHAARPLAPRGNTSELKLPSVIVDLTNDCRMLLEHLLAGDESASDKLVDMGTAAVTVLVNAFPGPLRHPSLRPGAEPTRASECGPVLRTLLRLGSKSVPFLVVRTNDGDPVVRRWAVHLLGELPTPESTHAVARRFFDMDEDVRKGARAAARLLLAHPEFGPALVSEFSELAEDRSKGTGMRQASIEALSDLRTALAVPPLIRVLTDTAPELVNAARSALVVVARQDFGEQPAPWAEWWRASGGRHRIEWLIDALTHESQDIRRAAGEELKILTREYFGYYDDLPARERERAQTRYREWWETRGKARFH